MAKRKTIATMTLVYENKEYYYENDFGYDYPAESALFMFEDGNYSCDCNLSAFIRSKYNNAIPDLECGAKIKIKNLKIIYRGDNG